MQSVFLIVCLLLTAPAVVCGRKVAPPKPVAPVPSPAQLEWQALEYYAFVHFGMNTFTGQEWGAGQASADNFQPSDFNPRQWAEVVKAAGMKGIIITAKHHDGFCLWQTKTTRYGVGKSSWRGGKGDVLQELAAACREYGLKFGVYISPWDRNHPLYGRPQYNRVYKEQWREILTGYGPVFEAWLDGANDRSKPMVYDFQGFFETIKTVQPGALIFSDAGPDIRWVGNEKGLAGETNWSLRDNEGTFPGFADVPALNVGDENGTAWIPAECDVSLRPGWFYHANEDGQVKSVAQLLDIYYGSVGRNCNLLLNIGVDRRGLVHEADARRLGEFRRALEEEFKINLARGRITASNVRDNNRVYDAEKVLDGKSKAFWATDDGVTAAALTLDFGHEVAFNRFLGQENIALGQRIKKFALQIWAGGEWQTVARGSTMGYKRLLRFPTVKTRKLKLVIEEAKACPTVANLEIYHAPESGAGGGRLVVER